MKFHSLRLLLIAFAVFVSTGGAGAETTAQTVQRLKVLKAGNNFAYPPFSYIDNGQQAGFDVDLGNEIAKRMGVRLEFEQIEFKGLIAALKSKRIDVILSAVTYSPERAAQITFSESYYDAGLGAAYLATRPITLPSDLPGKRIGVQSGSVADLWIRQKHESLVPNVKYYDTVIYAIKDLEAGRLDAVLHPMPTMKYTAKSPNVRFSSVWDSRQVGINTRLEDTELLGMINAQIVAVKKDGTYDRLVQKWFGSK